MPARAEPLLEAHDLEVGFEKRLASPARTLLEHVDLSVHAGRRVCVLGANGVGKSTLLRTLAGLQPPLKGSVRSRGEDLHRLAASERARRLSVVVQPPSRVGLLEVEALVGLGRYAHTGWLGRMRRVDQLAIERALEMSGALELRHRLFDQLSDGERQRVLMARALAQETELLILDEPMAFLDLPRRLETLALLDRWVSEAARSFILATHDVDHALTVADEVWLVRDGGVEVGVPEDLVLSGALAAAYEAAGVDFDLATGGFRLSNGRAATTHDGVCLRGPDQDHGLVWMRRALERTGHRVLEEAGGADVQHEIRLEAVAEGGWVWIVDSAGQQSRHDSIASVLERLAT